MATTAPCLSAPTSHNRNRQRFLRWRSQIARNPTGERGFGLRNRSPKSQIASDFPSRPEIAMQHCFLLSLGNRCDFWCPRWALQSQIAKIAAISVHWGSLRGAVLILPGFTNFAGGLVAWMWPFKEKLTWNTKNSLWRTSKMCCKHSTTNDERSRLRVTQVDCCSWLIINVCGCFLPLLSVVAHLL